MRTTGNAGNDGQYGQYGTDGRVDEWTSALVDEGREGIWSRPSIRRVAHSCTRPLAHSFVHSPIARIARSPDRPFSTGGVRDER